MTTDIAVLERAMVVMAVCMVVQTLLYIAGALGAFVAWRRAAEALTEAKAIAQAQANELRGHLERMSDTVDETAQALRHGTQTVDGVITDVRDAMGTVSRSVGSVASAVNAPRAALAIGVLEGLKYWRKRRAAQRMAAAATSEM
jgi:methyl-accepting chemotaxis protein